MSRASETLAACPFRSAERMIVMGRYKYCKGCDQPMLPKGRKKLPGEFDHAKGCKEATDDSNSS